MSSHYQLMAMAAGTLPQQHLPSQLPLGIKVSRRRAPTFCVLGHRAVGKERIISTWPYKRLRLTGIIVRASADAIPVQEEKPQASLSPEEEDEAMCRDILRVLEILNDKRDMPFNEVRLTIMIEDPSEEEKREQFDTENERGCSREEMGAALVDVYEGRMPSDRRVLQELHKEMVGWPNLEDESDVPSDPSQSPYARTTDTGVDPKIAAKRMKIDFDAAAEIEPGQDSEDSNVPPVVGFSVLYLVSAVPILIGITVVAILYINSFR